MPTIDVTTGRKSDEQKARLIRELTEVSSRIMEMPPQAFSVFIHELDDANMGVAGQTITEFRKSR